MNILDSTTITLEEVTTQYYQNNRDLSTNNESSECLIIKNNKSSSCEICKKNFCLVCQDTFKLFPPKPVTKRICSECDIKLSSLSFMTQNATKNTILMIVCLLIFPIIGWVKTFQDVKIPNIHFSKNIIEIDFWNFFQFFMALIQNFVGMPFFILKKWYQCNLDAQTFNLKE